jgi:hypothetical protein
MPIKKLHDALHSQQACAQCFHWTVFLFLTHLIGTTTTRLAELLAPSLFLYYTNTLAHHTARFKL